MPNFAFMQEHKIINFVNVDYTYDNFTLVKVNKHIIIIIFFGNLFANLLAIFVFMEVQNQHMKLRQYLLTQAKLKHRIVAYVKIYKFSRGLNQLSSPKLVYNHLYK